MSNCAPTGFTQLTAVVRVLSRRPAASPGDEPMVELVTGDALDEQRNVVADPRGEETQRHPVDDARHIGAAALGEPRLKPFTHLPDGPFLMALRPGLGHHTLPWGLTDSDTADVSTLAHLGLQHDICA